MAKIFFSMDTFFAACPNCNEDMVAARVRLPNVSPGKNILSAWVCDCNQDAIGDDIGVDVLAGIKSLRSGNRSGKGILI